MMNKFDIKTCGTCIAFGKSSCVYPTSEVNSIPCIKYHEISIPITKEENKLEHTLISVYKVNDRCIVARSIEDAIKLYKDAYESPYNEVKTVTLVEENAWIKSDKDDEKSE